MRHLGLVLKPLKDFQVFCFGDQSGRHLHHRRQFWELPPLGFGDPFTACPGMENRKPLGAVGLLPRFAGAQNTPVKIGHLFRFGIGQIHGIAGLDKDFGE